MDFGFAVISAEEYERQRELYGPLTEALRKLIGAGIHTEVDEDTVRQAQSAIEERQPRCWSAGSVARRRRCAMRVPGVRWRGPIPLSGCAMRSPRPMIIHHEDDGRAWSEFSLSGAYEGPPGWVHGGICALVLDHILGEAASDGLTKPKVTGTITLKYLRGTPLGQLRAEAFIERTEGVKTFARGYLGDAAGTTVEAEGVFIRPAWARDAG